MRNPLEPLERRRPLLTKPRPRWAATCNYCGAPLASGQCPRCGYQRRREVETVWSGAGGAADFEYFGSDKRSSGGVGPLTIPGLTLKPGECAIVALAEAWNSNPLGATRAVTWGGNSVASTFDIGIGDLTSAPEHCNLYLIDPPASETSGNVVATFSGKNSVSKLMTVVIARKVTSSPLDAVESTSSGNLDSFGDTTSPPSTTKSYIAELLYTQQRASEGGPTWGSGLIGVGRDGTSDTPDEPGFDPGTTNIVHAWSYKLDTTTSGVAVSATWPDFVPYTAIDVVLKRS